MGIWKRELTKGARWTLALILMVTVVASSIMVPIAIQESGCALFTNTFYIGMQGTAYAYTADYECDGINDHIEVQAAVDALPAGGGRVVLLAGNYNFGAAVTRAIGNITIEGTGPGTYIARDGINDVFTVGGDDWLFINHRGWRANMGHRRLQIWHMDRRHLHL